MKTDEHIHKEQIAYNRHYGLEQKVRDLEHRVRELTEENAILSKNLGLCEIERAGAVAHAKRLEAALDHATQKLSEAWG